MAGACGRPAVDPPGDAPRYAYALDLPPPGSWSLGVEAVLEHASSPSLVMAGWAGSVHDVSVVGDEGAARPVARRDDAWVAPECRTRCRLRYAVDLDALAASCKGIDCARRVGDAVFGSANAWMIVPDAGADGIVRVRIASGDLTRFATGLRAAPDGGYVLRTREIGEAAYTAFGQMRSARVQVAGATLSVALLGQPLAMTDRGAVEWVQHDAECVAAFFGRFPVDTTVFVVPVSGADEVVFGRVFSLAGASVALLFGADTRPEAAHDDWVVVHELFHLGTPSFVGEGHWLEEGLATYYEPILRERAGWMTEADLWKHFASEMPRGVRRPGSHPNIEERDDIDSTYWGGALFALAADVGILNESGGTRSLDDVLRAVLEREGDATHATRVQDFLRTGDETTGTHVLSRLHTEIATGGGPVDLEAIFRSLGVEVTRGGRSVELRDDAPLASVRRAIASGRGH
jgi:predicted metalloprotease with PDZ domain